MDYLPTLGEKWPHSRGNGLVNIPYMDPMGNLLKKLVVKRWSWLLSSASLPNSFHQSYPILSNHIWFHLIWFHLIWFWSILTWNPLMTSIFEGKNPPKTRPFFSNQNEGPHLGSRYLYNLSSSVVESLQAAQNVRSVPWRRRCRRCPHRRARRRRWARTLFLRRQWDVDLCGSST